jgi:hypothetical protein
MHQHSGHLYTPIIIQGISFTLFQGGALFITIIIIYISDITTLLVTSFK